MINKKLSGSNINFLKDIERQESELFPSDNIFPLDRVVYSALQLSKNKLNIFANSPDFQTQMQLAFGNGVNPNRLQQSWQNQDFSAIPNIEIISGTELSGAVGAFASLSNTIYLSQEYLRQNAANISNVASVLLEEIGHAVDTQLNIMDSPGDEGELFSALVRGQELSESTILELKSENDTALISLDGLEVTIEKAVNVPYQSGLGGVEGDTQVINLEGKQGTIDLSYRTFTVPDRLQLVYQGNLIFDSGFESTGGLNPNESPPPSPKKVQIQFNGDSQEVTSILTANKFIDTTKWDYTVDSSVYVPNQKDSIYEFLDKDVAYKTWKAENNLSEGYEGNKFKQLVGDYKVDKVFDDPSTGFFGLGLISNQKAPVLAIRGTEPTANLFADIFADIDSKGVGFNQYNANRDLPLQWLSEVSSNKLKNPNLLLPDITGHSLGGALSQLFAADFTKSGNKLGDVVTFNSPGINKNNVKDFKKENAGRVNHYIVSGDIVSLAGEAYLPGEYDLLDFFNYNLLNNHLLPVLTSEVNYDKKTDDKLLADGKSANLTRPSDVKVISNNTSVDWLNNSFFTYVEPEFLTLLGGAIVATKTIPPLKLFELIPPLVLLRGTVEGSRQTIGNVGNSFKTIGEGIDKITKAINEQDSLLSSTGVQVKLPKQNFNILGLLDINATDLAMEYVPQPEKIFKIQGKVSVPTLFNAEANFAEKNFIQISNSRLDVKGSLSVKDISIVPHIWEVKKAGLSFDTIKKEVKGEGTVLIPTGIEIAGGLGFKDGKFNFISLGVDNLNKPIGTTGAFLQSISGKIDNINNFADLNQIDFGGNVGITGGPEVSVSLPSWAGGGFSGSLIKLDVQGSINRDRLKGDGNLSILNGLAKGSAGAELNWNQGLLNVSTDLSILNDFIKTNTKFKANSNFDIVMTGKGTVKIPDISFDTPLIPGGKIAFKSNQPLDNQEFVFEYTNNGNPSSDDFVRAYREFDIPFIGKYQATIKASFDGKVEATIGQSLPKTGSFTITPGTKWLVLNANWDKAAANLPIRVKTPNGTFLNESDFAANNIAVVDTLTTSTTKAVIVTNPQAGIWDIKVADPTGLGNVHYSAFKDSIAPTIEVTTPATDVTGQNPIINYSAFDADSNAKVSLFYDTDNKGFDGILIKNGLSETDGTGSFTWNTEGVSTGNYYVYAMAMDENNAPVFSYSPGRVQVTESADLSVSKTANADPVVVGKNLTYTITVTNKGASNAKGVILTDALPEGASFVSSSLTPTNQSDNALTFDLGNLDKDASKKVDITVTPPKTGIITSTARIIAKTFDPDVNNNVAVLATAVEPISTDLALTTTASPTTANLGDKITYDLIVTNNSSTKASNIKLTDNLPFGVRTGKNQDNETAVSATDSNGNTYTEANGVISAELGDLESGKSVKLSITTTSIATGTLINTANVTSDEVDFNSANNSLIQRTIVNPIAPIATDLELTQTVNNANPKVGDEVIFTLTLTNKGPGVATSIKVTDVLPKELSFLSNQAEQGTYDSKTGVWNVGNMRDNLSRTLRLVAKVNASVTTINKAEVTSVSQLDPDSTPGNNNPKEDDQASVTLNSVNSIAETLKLTKTANDIFTISGGNGKPKLQVSLTGQSNNSVNELSIFTVDDPSGNIGGIAPGAVGYTDAALKRSKVVLSAIANIPNGFNPKELTRLVEFNSGENLRFYLVRNSTTDAVRSGQTPISNLLFSSATTQKVTDLGNGEYTLAWEDGGGNSADFRDMVVKIKPAVDALALGTNLQDKPEGEVIDLRTVDNAKQVKADFTVNREAGFNNVVGFYKVVDENGGIDINGDGKFDLRPTDAGYAQAAMNARVADINLSVNNQGTANINDKLLTGGSIFAPYLITNGGTVEQVLSGQTNQVYFAYLGANSDKVDHVRLLGNNTFGFEDLAGGGDFDYNDVIVRANLTPVA